MFSKILVATDSSEHAKRALVVAGEIASRFDADLVVLNVFSRTEMNEPMRHMAEVENLLPPRHLATYSDLDFTRIAGLPFDPTDETDISGVMYRAFETISQRLADDGVKLSRKAGASKVKAIAREGDPAEEILNVAKDERIDLIVLGSRGLGTLEGLLMGSVSSKVNNHSDCCCITVK